MSMNEDLGKYPVFVILGRKLKPSFGITNTDDYNHLFLQMNHFVRQSVRKNSPDFYKRVEHLQKLILMPSQMNYDLETMGEGTFLKRWGMNKNDLIFSRLKWREGYYEGLTDDNIQG